MQGLTESVRRGVAGEGKWVMEVRGWVNIARRGRCVRECALRGRKRTCSMGGRETEGDRQREGGREGICIRACVPVCKSGGEAGG